MKTLILILVLTFSNISKASPSETFGHVYVAAGELFGLGALRVGTSTWEAGLLNGGALGFANVVYKGSLYGMGGIIITPATSMPGLFGAIGREWNFLKVFGFRIEGNIAHTVDNFSKVQAHIGLSAGW